MANFIFCFVLPRDTAGFDLEVAEGDVWDLGFEYAPLVARMRVWGGDEGEMEGGEEVVLVGGGRGFWVR